MSDPISATIQTVQLGISAVKAGAAIAGLWESRRARNAAAASQEDESKPKRGPGIDEILLVLSTLGQRLLLLDVVYFDTLPEAYKAVRGAMEAVDADDDDVGYQVDLIGPVLQHLVATAMMFCAACHPMPIWHGFGCGVMDDPGWADPSTWNMWTFEIDRAISLLKSVPQGFQLFKKSPGRIGREEPYYEEYSKKVQKGMDGFMKDFVKQFEKNGLPKPLSNEGIQVRSWWFSGGTYGGSSIYSTYGHNYLPLSQYQLDTGRFFYAWTIGEHADLQPWEAVLLVQPHIMELAVWLEGLNGITFKVLRDTDLDWSKIKLKSSTKKFNKAETGNDHGLNNEPFMLIRNPDPAAIIAKRLDELHFISVTVTATTGLAAGDTSLPASPKEKQQPSVTITPLEPSSPPQSPTTNPSSPVKMSAVPIIRRAAPSSAQKTPPAASETVRSSISSTTTIPNDVSCTTPITTATTPPPSPPEDPKPALSFNMTADTNKLSRPAPAPTPAPANPIQAQTPPLSPPASPSALPPGWEERALSNGQVFYIDHTTKATTWTRPDPSMVLLPPPPPSYDDSKTTTSTPLPPGWEMRLDAQKRIYYVDHNLKKTSWVRPSVLAVGT